MAYKPGKSVIAAVAISFSMSALPVTSSYAALVPTEQMIDHKQIETQRDQVASFMARKDVQQELEKYGVDPKEAALRVAALSDAEINKISNRIDQIPAGQDAGAAIIGAAVTVFVILLITDLLCLTSVFSFTRCAR